MTQLILQGENRQKKWGYCEKHRDTIQVHFTSCGLSATLAIRVDIDALYIKLTCLNQFRPQT